MDTKALQSRLIELGYDLGQSGADGVFGRMTISAVTEFQKDFSVDVQYPGTVGPKTIAALNAIPTGTVRDLSAETAAPPWYVEARRKIGLQEVINNRSLSEYLKSDGHTLGDPSKLPWCGDFMETVIALTLPHEPMIVNPYWALNWTKFGIPIDIIALGAIAPFGRNGGGHIAMIVGHDKDYFHCLGGNQSNSICIVRIAKDRLSGPLRWPSTYPKPTEALPFTTIAATISKNES